MKEKGIRYSTLGLNILIILSILLSNIFSVLKPVVNNYFIQDERLRKDYYYETLSTYFVGNEGIYSQRFYDPGNMPIKYFSVRKIIVNYKETEEYIKGNSKSIIYKHKYVPNRYFEIQNHNDEYMEVDYYDEYGSYVKNDYDLISDGSGPFEEKFQKPKYEEIKYSNDEKLDFAKVNLEELESKLKDEIYFTLDLGKDTKELYINNEKKLNKESKEFIDFVVDKVSEEQESSEVIESKSLMLLVNNGEKLNYQVNEKIDIYKKVANMATFIVLISLMFLLIALATGFKKSKDVKFYKRLQAIPVEFVATGLLALSLGLAGFTEFISRSTWYEFSSTLNFNIDINIILILVLTFTLAGLIFFILYFINGLKSLYHEGFNSFVFQNSITYRLSRWIFRVIKNIVTKIYRVIVGNNLTNKNRRLISFILIWIIGSALFGFHPYVVILLFLLMAGIYYLLSRVLSDVQNIEDATYEINKGNFNINLNEDNTYFGNISRNLNNINESLTNAMDKELKSERMKTELITNLSHDLKTPLTAIINYSDLAADETLTNEERKKYLDIVNEKSIKLKTLIERLFEVSKVTSRNVTFNYMDIDLNQMITQMIGEWHEDFSRRGIEVVFNSQKDSTIQKLDGEQTSRILDNIFSNINKYAQDNTRVYIDLSQNGQTKLVVKNVSKYSLNITPDELKERFTRGDESRNTEGSGLGLAIASSLTELQSGKFDIEIDGDLFKTIITFNN